MLVEGTSIRDLYHAALAGMNEIITEQPVTNTPNTQSEAIHITSLDQTTLLIDFLSEVLTLSQINRIIYNLNEIDSLSETELKCSVRGYKIERFKEDIKAVTYHEAEVKCDESGIWSTFIIFDI